MNTFHIAPNSIHKLNQAYRTQINTCQASARMGTCDVCATCSDNRTPFHGEAKVDRYTAVKVGANDGIVKVTLRAEGVLLSGSKGNFYVSDDMTLKAVL